MTSLQNKKNKALKMMLWFGIGSLFMTFAGLTSALIVSKNRADWMKDFVLPIEFNYSLLVIIASSVFLFLAKKYLKKNKNKEVSVFLFITITLGMLFILLQFLGFGKIVSNGFHFTGPTSTINSSFVFLIAFVHVLHLVVALVALLVVFFKNIKGQYNKQNFTGFELASIFWHFVDFLWIYLFIFLVFFA